MRFSHYAKVFLAAFLGVTTALVAAQVTTNPTVTGKVASVLASITAATGTGTTVVLQTSPTLVTPNIGAASGTTGTFSGKLQATNGPMLVGGTNTTGFWGSGSVSHQSLVAYSDTGTAIDTANKGLVVTNLDQTASNLSSIVFGTQNTGNTPIASGAIWTVNGTRGAAFSASQVHLGAVRSNGVIGDDIKIDGSANTLTLNSSVVTPASSGTRFICISTAGVISSSASACSGT